jgi:hypothetical protein
VRAQLDELEVHGASVEVARIRFAQPNMLHDENWEAHALLGRRAVELILLIDDASLRLSEFDKKIRGGMVGTDASSQAGTPRGTDPAERIARHTDKIAIRDYADTLSRLQSALEALAREMERAPHVPALIRLVISKLPRADVRRGSRLPPNAASRQGRKVRPDP